MADTINISFIGETPKQLDVAIPAPTVVETPMPPSYVVEVNDDKQISAIIEAPSPPKTEEKKTKKKKVVAVVEKKGPGRPRKFPKKESAPRRGIALTPQQRGNFLEVVYDQPAIMKKVFLFFKAISASEFQIVFQPGKFCIYGYDHYQKSRVKCEFNAAKLNHFYCQDNVDLGINCLEFNKLIDVADKDSLKVCIYSTIQNIQKEVQVTVINDDDFNNCFRLQLIALKKRMTQIEISEFDDNDYTITMDMKTRRFKKIISDLRSISDKMSVEQEHPDAEIYMSCQASNKKTEQTIEFKNKKSIRSVLAANETFHVDILTDHLKQISSSIPSEEITLMFHEKKKIKTRSVLDGGTIIIETLTSIITDQPDPL